jgi:hypothetical protein
VRHSSLKTRHILSKILKNHEVEFQGNGSFSKSSSGIDNTKAFGDVYSSENQIRVLSHSLWLLTQAREYISCGHASSMYLGKSHLAPNNDALFVYQTKAAFNYNHAAPQWKALIVETGIFWRSEWGHTWALTSRMQQISLISTARNGTYICPKAWETTSCCRFLLRSGKWFMRDRNAGIVFVSIKNPHCYDIWRVIALFL